MMKRIISLICLGCLVIGLCSSVIVFAEKDIEYITADVGGFESYSKVAVSMCAATGVKTFGVSTLEMPGSGLNSTVKLTASKPAEGVNSISYASCRVTDKDIEDKFVDGSHTDAVVSGKTYLPFDGIDLSDSEGIRVYLATGATGALKVLNGTVKMQFAMTPTRGLSTNAAYAEYDVGFVFESVEVKIGADGYAYVPFEGAKPVDSNTPADANFAFDYLPEVNAVNIVFTPEEAISEGNIYYIGGLRPYRVKAENSIFATTSGNCSATLKISGLSDKEGELRLTMDGEDIPPYFESTVGTDCFGATNITYIIDTTAVGEGAHKFALFNSGKMVCERTLVFDNTLPYLAYSSIKDGSSQPANGVIDMRAADGESGVADFRVTLDGKEINLPYNYSSLKEGSHALWCRITDNIGRVARESISFTVSSDITYGEYTVNGNNITLAVNAKDRTSVIVYSAAGKLPVYAYSNVAELSEMSAKTPEGETALASASYNRTESKNSKYPYQAFEVDVSGVTESNVKVSCAAAAMIGETLLLCGYNETKGEWVELTRERMVADSITLSATVPLEGYAKDGKIKLRVSLLTVDNGSDSIAWSSDLQHCLQHNYEDGSYREYTYYVTEQKEWFVSEYNNGNIAYAIDTGDISDEPNNPAMFAEARQLFNVLEEANIPNGVLAGNHDANWTNWTPYFGNSYYQDKDCFGGAYMDNRCHYDLVTIDGRDFIILCMGWNTEQDADALAWARNILNTYSNRTAIFATHGYLGTEGQILYDSAWKFEKIVEDCPNVRLVICGHEPGAADNIRTTADGRKVTEILQDYQSGMPDYNWWKWSEGGSGLFRYLTFGENTVESRAFTASTDDYLRVFGRNPEDGYYYWDYDLENFTLPVDLMGNTRRIDVYSFTARSSDATSKIYSLTVKKRKVTFENTVGDGLWFVVCGGITSAVYPVEQLNSTVPTVTSAFGVNGTLNVEWEYPAEASASGFAVCIDGVKVATVDGSKRSCNVAVGIYKDENVTVSVIAETEGEKSLSSDGKQVVFTGAARSLAGDFDESGEIDITDALGTLRASLKLSVKAPINGFFASDMDKDGSLTVSDALRILRVSAGY